MLHLDAYEWDMCLATQITAFFEKMLLVDASTVFSSVLVAILRRVKLESQVLCSVHIKYIHGVVVVLLLTSYPVLGNASLILEPPGVVTCKFIFTSSVAVGPQKQLRSDPDLLVCTNGGVSRWFAACAFEKGEW